MFYSIVVLKVPLYYSVCVCVFVYELVPSTPHIILVKWLRSADFNCQLLHLVCCNHVQCTFKNFCLSYLKHK